AVCTLLSWTGSSAAAHQTAAIQPSAEAPKFDPKADPARDLKAAVADATRTHRRIILDVGGEWCSWCHTLDKFLAAHSDLIALRDKNFVWLKVNFSPE